MGVACFWEKKWKSIAPFSYFEHTFLVVWNYMYCEGASRAGFPAILRTRAHFCLVHGICEG